MPPFHDPFAGDTEDQREAVARAMFSLQLWLEDRRGVFTWMWVIGLGSIAWNVFKIVSDQAWVSANGWWVTLSTIAAIVLLISGVALRINAALEMRYFKRLESIAARLRS